MKTYHIFIIFLLFRFEEILASASITTIHKVVADWKNLQIVDARTIEEFRMDHLPGAIHMDWRKFRQHELTMQERLFGISDGRVLSDPVKLEKILTNLGLREDIPILVYGGRSRWGEEGRIAWNLLYWGAKDVRLLDGGWQAWASEKPRVEKIVHKKKVFSVGLVPKRRIEFDEVKYFVVQKKLLIDVRSKSEIVIAKILHSKQFDDSYLYKINGKFPERNELLSSFPFIEEGEVVYCTGGVRSALAAIIIEARIGKVMRNYDGSMWDWRSKNSF